MPDEEPLASSGPAAEPLPTAPEGEPAPPGEDEEDDDDEEDPEPAPRPRPPAPTFKVSTFLYLFMGMLGIWMLFEASARNQIAGLLGISSAQAGPLYFAIGFGSSYLLLTMALAAVLEMLFTALAYNYTTDWIKAAKVQSWSSAFRKVQMAAIRSGKKDRIDALKPHQEKLARLSGEVTIAQFKGMAITYFLLILIYTWVGLVISSAPIAAQSIQFVGAHIDLMGYVIHYGTGGIPWWFLIFSVYTIPSSMLFRRVLKHLWLRRYVEEHPPVQPGPSPLGAAGGPA